MERNAGLKLEGPSGFQWAEPLENGRELEVEQVGSELHISGLLPSYRLEDAPSDLIRQFEKAPKSRPIGLQRAGKESPDMRFANADSDDKLIAFVRRFGPVVVNRVDYTPFISPKRLLTPEEQTREPQSLGMLIVYQDMQEPRNENVIYRAALRLIMLLKEPPTLITA